MTASASTFGLNIPVSRIYSFLKGIFILNILFLTGTWLHAEKVLFPDIITLQWVLAEFNFAKENVVASWYSSMLMFCIGLSAALCFWADMLRAVNNKDRFLNYGWLIMAGVFIVLSFDEMGSFHEMISQTPLFTKVGGGKGKYTFFSLIGLVALFMVVFFIVKFKTNKIALLLTIIGVLLFVSNPFQEKFEIDSYRSAPDPGAWHRPFIFLLMEEGSEIFASFCFLFSFIIYAINASPRATEKMLTLSSPLPKKIILWPGALLVLLGITMLVIHIYAWNMEGDDNGVPHDWPPAATAFVCFVASIYLYFKKGFEKNRPVYLAIAVAGIFTSIYYGAFMYGYSHGPFTYMPVVLLAITILAGLFAVVKLDELYSRLLVLAWVGFSVASGFDKGFITTALGYAGCGCLLLALVQHYLTSPKAAHS